MKTRILYVMILLLAVPAAAQTWYLNVEEHFDGGALAGDWTGLVAAGDPCGYVDESGGLLDILSQCGPGHDSPAPTLAQLDLELPADWRVVVRMNKSTSSGWCMVQLSENLGVLPPDRVLGLFLNGTGVGGGYGSVSLRQYWDGTGTFIDGGEYAFGVGVFNVWSITKEGDAISVEVGPTEETLAPLYGGSDPALFDGGYLTLQSSQAGALLHVDWVKVYSHLPVSNEDLDWSGIKRLWE